MKNRNIHSLGMAVALLALSGSVASAQFSILHSFTGGADGANPYYDAPVVSSSTLYGTANQGAAGGGVVFAVNTDGTGFNVLHTFTNTAPASGLIEYHETSPPPGAAFYRTAQP